jgi:type 1 glutamine amidotransferase
MIAEAASWSLDSANMNGVTSMLRGLLLGILAVGVGALALADDAAKQTRILLVYTRPDHAHGTHMYEFECRLLARCLRQTRGVEPVVALDWPEDGKALEGVKSIVYYSRPAGDIVLSAKNREAFLKLMKDGVGFVAIHWGTGAAPERKEEYTNVLGGWFHRPPCGLKVDTRPLVQADPAHPICRGWQPFDLREEFYLDLAFHAQSRPIFKANVDGKEQVVAWAFERPDTKGGRSFGTTLGHFHENFTLVPFRKAIVNGILWTAHVEIPKEGAPVLLSSEETTLPVKK